MPPMPGTKSSGRKKKMVEEHGETEAAPTSATKKKVGRPKKVLMESITEDTSDVTATSTAELEVTAEASYQNHVLAEQESMLQTFTI